MFALVDIITYNSLFVIMLWIYNPILDKHESWLTLLAFNLALVPSLIFTFSTHANHAVTMDRAVMATLKGISIHLLFLFALLSVIQCNFISPWFWIYFYASAIYGAENEAYKLRVWENAVDCFLYQCVMIDLGRTWPQNEAYKKFASFYIVFTYEPVFRGDSGEKVYMGGSDGLHRGGLALMGAIARD